MQSWSFSLPICLLLFVAGCNFFCQSSDFGFSDKTITEVPSPDGKHVATLFERDCGATTDFSMIVVLRRTAQNFNPEKNRIFIVSGKTEIDVRWADKSHLDIFHNAPSNKIFKAENEFDSITISYTKPR
jgi:hypothetical protein